MNLTDEGPIIAKALGLDLEDAEGAVINSFFRFAQETEAEEEKNQENQE